MQTLDICNVSGLAFGFKIHNNLNLRDKLTYKMEVLMITISLHGKSLHRLHFSRHGVEVL